MASRAASRTLTEHDEIRQWAEERGATPACVRGTGGDGDTGMIRLDFPGYSGAQSLEPIDWDDWFQKFDESRLALLVQDETAGGERSNFNKLIGRETARAREEGDNRASRRHPERSSGHRRTSRTSASAGSKRRSASSSGASSSRSANKGSRSSGNRSARVSGSSSRSKRASSSGSRSKAASSRSRSAGSKRSSSRSRSTASSSRSRGTNSAAKRRTTAAWRNRGSKSRSTASTRGRSTRASSSRSSSNRSRTASRGRTSSAASHFLTDHDEIRRWAEEREASPACVRGTGGGEDVGMIRLDFPGYSGAQSLEHIDWDEWFQKFDDNNLALLVQEKTARGQQSNFNKLVSRETAKQGGRAASGRKSSSGARAGGSRRRAA